MKKHYVGLACLLCTLGSVSSCQRAPYTFRPTDAHPETVAAVVTAPTAPEASTVAAPVALVPAARQAAAWVAAPKPTVSTSIANPVTALPTPTAVAGADEVITPATQQATPQQPATRRKKSKKVVWILVGVGVLLAIIRVVIASDKQS